MIIQFSAQIDEVKRNKDRTLRLKVDTQEIPPEESAHIFELQDKQIWIAMSEVPVKNNEFSMPESVDEFDKKTSSQRLRDRQFVYWKKKGIKGDFDTWRKAENDRIGLKYLEAIE